MDRKTNKSKRRKKSNIDDFQIEQDENFPHFIMSLTYSDFLNLFSKTCQHITGNHNGM